MIFCSKAGFEHRTGAKQVTMMQSMSFLAFGSSQAVEYHSQRALVKVSA